MLVQKELEAKITTALSAALSTASVDGVEVRGAWATSMSGLVKWVESGSDTPAFLSVSVACPSWQTFSAPTVDFAVSLALFVRCELDSTGSKLCEVAEVIETLLKSWQTSTYQSPFTDLDLENLSIDGLSLGGGSSPTLNDGTVSVAWNFTLSGSFNQ